MKEKSKLEIYGRFILRMFSCFAIGLISDMIMAILFFMWGIIFFGAFSYQTTQVFTFILINSAFFLGTCVAGYLSGNFKRSIIVSISISVILGVLFIIFSGVLFGVINIIIIVTGGLIGGLINEKNYFSET